jgi:hypothetical protein
VEFISSILPVTVLAAAILFFIKEILEFSRRRSSERRRMQAIKILLARELELNNWARSRLRQTLDTVEHGLKARPKHLLSARLYRNGEVRFRAGQGGGFVSWPIDPFHNGAMAQHMLDVAILDRSLFEKLEEAFDTTSELIHVRRRLIDGLLNEENDADQWLEGLLLYGKSQIEEAERSMSVLYKACTDKNFTAQRVR